MALTKFCAKCGGEVLTSCMGCDAPIQGHYVPPGVSAVGGRLVPPGFCSTCGKPHPWTEEKIAAARELTDELVDLSIEDRDQLKTAIEQVATDGPRAEAAAARIKRLIGKASSAVGQAIWKITVDVASEAAKKILTGT
jgi:hypothetical protein